MRKAQAFGGKFFENNSGIIDWQVKFVGNKGEHALTLSCSETG